MEKSLPLLDPMVGAEDGSGPGATPADSRIEGSKGEVYVDVIRICFVQWALTASG